MKNILFFIYKYYSFLLFFFLEVLAFMILYRFNHYQRASFLNYTGSAASVFYEGVNNTTTYFSLRRINDSLLAENARLRSQMLNSFYQNSFSLSEVNDTLYKQQYAYISANVVNNSVTKRNNYITIDKGRKHGLEPEMGVISSNGVVGIVMTVSDHYATVLSLLNNNCKISAMMKKNSAFGSLVWDGVDPKFARLLDVNKHVPIAVNDEIVTSNYSTIFPQGIAVGRIFAHSLEAGDNFHTIRVELYSDFSTLKNVFVIRNLMKGEQRNLEAKTSGEE